MKRFICFAISIFFIALGGILLSLAVFPDSSDTPSAQAQRYGRCIQNENRTPSAMIEELCGYVIKRNTLSSESPAVGATVHYIAPDGTRSSTVADQQGIYRFFNVKANGDIKISLEGFNDQTFQRCCSTKRMQVSDMLLLPKQQCNDGRDNDSDGKIDYPADSDCISLEDPQEGSDTSGVVLKGRVYLSDTTVPLSRATIKVRFSDNQEISLGNTDEGGYYQSNANTALRAEDVAVEATHEKFESEREYLTLHVGENTQDFFLDIADPNQVKGITYQLENGIRTTAKAGVKIEVHDKDTSAFIGSAKSDRRGRYLFRSEKLKAGDYTIYAVNSANIRLSPVYSINFPNAREEDKELDIDVQDNTSHMYNVFIQVFEEAWTQDEGTKPVSEASVALITEQGTQSRHGFSDTKGQITFAELSEGSYTINVAKDGYTTSTINLVLYGEPKKPDKATVYLRKNTYDCEKHPQTNVQEFWFCGEAAKQLYARRMGAWRSIDTEVGRIRQVYSDAIYNDLPRQIVIDSIEYDDATFSPAPASILASGCVPLQKRPNEPGIGETLTFTSKAIENANDVLLAHITTHEAGGHGRDNRKANCRGYWSYTNPFLSLYAYASEQYGDSYFKALNESTYDVSIDPIGGKEIGHSEDEEPEADASAFHDMTHHRDEFPPSAISGELRQLLLETGRLSELP